MYVPCQVRVVGIAEHGTATDKVRLVVDAVPHHAVGSPCAPTRHQNYSNIEVGAERGRDGERETETRTDIGVFDTMSIIQQGYDRLSTLVGKRNKYKKEKKNGINKYAAWLCGS